MTTPSLYDTTTLLQVVRLLPLFDPLLLHLFFPDIVTFDTESIAFDKLDVDGNRKLAPFVSPLVAGQARRINGGEVRSFKPAYVKPLTVVDVGRVLRRRPGEAFQGTMSALERRDDIIVENLQMERDQCLRRFEWMGAQALRTGKVVVSGEDYPSVEVDFKRTSTLTKTLTTTARWSQATSAPLDDIVAWDAELEAPSTDIVFTPRAWKHFHKHSDVKEALNAMMRGGQSALEIAPGNGALVQPLGYIGPKRAWLYTGWYLTDAGVRTPFLADGEIILGSREVRGVRAFGAILDPRAGYQAVDIFPKNWISENPAAEFTMTQSAPLMVPCRPDASMCVLVTDEA
jgi:hypothetical protein